MKFHMKFPSKTNFRQKVGYELKLKQLEIIIFWEIIHQIFYAISIKKNPVSLTVCMYET